MEKPNGTESILFHQPLSGLDKCLDILLMCSRDKRPVRKRITMARVQVKGSLNRTSKLEDYMCKYNILLTQLCEEITMSTSTSLSTKTFFHSQGSTKFIASPQKSLKVPRLREVDEGEQTISLFV